MFRKLRSSARVDSIQSSNAIEGIIATGERVRELVERETEPFNHEEREILGYRNMLDEICAGYRDMEITAELLKHFHAGMLGMTTADAGKYKRENNWIQERSEDGRIRVRFVPVAASITPDAMEQMILAYHEAKQDSSINGLLLAACMVVDFLCIHPFRDGNGRVSRLLTSLLLLREGFDIGLYVSIDKKIREYSYGYYEALRVCSGGWHENSNTYVPFITFLLQILYACYKELDGRFIENSTKKHSKSEQIEKTLLECYVPVSKEEIAARFPEISISTIERVLGTMVREGKIQKIGTYRDARYKRT